METSRNRAELTGRAAASPQYSHSNHGADYYLFPIEVERLSGTVDTLNIVVSEDLLRRCPISTGEVYRVSGEVRSFNNRSGVGNRLVITLFARELEPAAAEERHNNALELTGVLCKMPVVRRTPLGREICDLLLAVNRRYGRSDYLPCIAWGAVARSCGRLSVGDRVHMTGRLQSRKYRKAGQYGETEKTAYEVSVMTLEPDTPP